MDHAIAQLRPRLHEVVVADAVEHHAVVDVVADDPRVRMLHQHVRERRDLGLRVDHAGRIARIVEQENLRAGQRRIELCRRQLVVLARRTRQKARFRVEDVGDVDVGRPVRHRERDRVARIEQRLGEVVQHVLGADAGRDVRALVAGQAAFLEMFQERIEQRVGAAIRAVLAAVFRQRVAYRVVHVRAGQEIRNADREADDVAAGGFELLGLVGHDHDRARLGAAHARSESQHGCPRRIALAGGRHIEGAGFAKPFNSNTALLIVCDGAKPLALTAPNAQNPLDAGRRRATPETRRHAQFPAEELGYGRIRR